MEFSIQKTAANWKRIVASVVWAGASAGVAWNLAGNLAAAVTAVIVATIGYSHWLPRLGAPLEALPVRSRVAFIAVTLLSTWLLLRAVPVIAPASLPTGIPRLAFHGIHLAAVWPLLVGAGFLLVRFESTSRPLRRWESWLLPVLPVFTWSIWLLAFYPGMLSGDSIDQWKQVSTGRLVDWHPVTHTMLIAALRSLWPSPAIVAIAQILLSAVVCGWVARWLSLAGAPRWALWTNAILLASSPLYGPFVITLWKDIPFSLGLVVLTVMLLPLVRRQVDGVRWRYWILLSMVGASIILFRHNGIPSVLGAVAAAILLQPRYWRQAALAGLAALVIASSTRAAIVHVYDAEPFSQSFAFVGFLGSHVAGGTPLMPDEEQILEEIHPLENRWAYYCYTQGPTLFRGKFDREAVERHKKALPLLTLRLTLRNPSATFAHLACASSLVWRIRNVDAPLYGPHVLKLPNGSFRHIDENPFGISPSAILPEVREQLARMIEWTMRPENSWLFWRPAVPLYLLAFAALVVCLRARSWRPSLILLPLALHTAALIVFIPSQSTRYQLPVILAALLLVPGWLFVDRPDVPEARTEQ